MKRLSLYLLLACGSASADFINGNFSTNSLPPWTAFSTPQGISVSSVANFDTTGNGANPAARFFVGSNPPGTQQGGGIQQALNLAQGSYMVTADIAAALSFFRREATPTFDLGLFQLLVNDVVVESYNFGILNFNDTKRDELVSEPFFGPVRRDPFSNSTTWNSGSNGTIIFPQNEWRASIAYALDVQNPNAPTDFKFQFVRDGLNGTMAHYIDNIAITANGIPEPSSLALVGSCAIAAWLLRRKRN